MSTNRVAVADIASVAFQEGIIEEWVQDGPFRLQARLFRAGQDTGLDKIKSACLGRSAAAHIFVLRQG